VAILREGCDKNPSLPEGGIMLTMTRWKGRPNWAVFDGDDLVVVTVYRKGAQEVIRRLSLLQGEHHETHHEGIGGTVPCVGKPGREGI
jgi:hypothetical protein